MFNYYLRRPVPDALRRADRIDAKRLGVKIIGPKADFASRVARDNNNITQA